VQAVKRDAMVEDEATASEGRPVTSKYCRMPPSSWKTSRKPLLISTRCCFLATDAAVQKVTMVFSSVRDRVGQRHRQLAENSA
jgi:hypothetical protein